MTQEHQAILALLKSSAVGKQNAIKSDDIFRQLTSQGMPIFQGRTQEQIRQNIRELVNTETELIGSGSNGYFIISNAIEAKESIESLEQRATTIKARANHIKNLWNSNNPANTI